MTNKTTADYANDIDAAIEGIGEITDQCCEKAQAEEMSITDCRVVAYTLKESVELLSAIHGRLMRLMNYQTAIVQAVVNHVEQLDGTPQGDTSNKQSIEESAEIITTATRQIIEAVSEHGDWLASQFPDDPAVPAVFNEAKRSLQRVINLVVAKYDVMATETQDDDSPGRSQ